MLDGGTNANNGRVEKVKIWPHNFVIYVIIIHNSVFRIRLSIRYLKKPIKTNSFSL